jgi:hypothetical protein
VIIAWRIYNAAIAAKRGDRCVIYTPGSFKE